MASSSQPEDALFRERLAKDIAEWQREGLIRPDQAQTLLARYGLLAGETPRTLRRSRIVFLLAVLGVVLVGVGVILLIGANWEQMPRWSRLALLICATLGSYLAGYRMAYQSKTYPKIGLAFLLLGSLLWGASIFLIAQMYHLGAGGGEGGEAKAVLYWFIGVLPLAYLLLSPLHLMLSLILGTIWLCMVLVAAGEQPPQIVMLFILALGVALYAFGRLHSMRASLQSLCLSYHWFGLMYIFTALYASGFQDFWVTYDASPPSKPWLWLLIISAASVAALLGLFLTRARRDWPSFYETAALSLLLLVCIGIFAVPADLLRHPSEITLLMMALFNLLLFGAEIGLIALGWRRNQPALANLGIFAFFVQVISRYFDLFGGMLTSGFVFIGAGLLLVFGGAALERSRRKLLEAMAQRRPQ